MLLCYFVLINRQSYKYVLIIKIMDKKDKQLLMLLQENSRESLTNLAKKINLSIDSTHKRLKKLHNSGIINRYGIFINPKVLQYDLVVDIKIKLHNDSR